MARNEVVEQRQTEGPAREIDKGADAVFLRLAFLVVMVVVVMMVLMFMLVMMFVMMLIMFIIVVFIRRQFVAGDSPVIIIVVMDSRFHLMDPGGRARYAVEVETAGADEFVEFHVAVVALDNLRLGLNGADNLADMREFVFAHLRGFVEEDHVAELNLLNDEVLDIVLFEMFFLEAVACSELIPHAEGIHDGGDAVHDGHAVLGIGRRDGRIGADGLRDRRGLTDAAGFDDDIVKLLRRSDVVQLLDEVGAERAADAAVLQRYERVILLGDDAALLDERSVNVYLAQVVYDDGEPDSLTVLQNAV